ncbi:hypothetical protein FGG08_004439 [Glutinoglossum americanum]|uniref:Tyrosine specific protein phosphatases domain-containing protein n=1 Tax=Glutinoglossum americanum TaxID=1670608 RepID=A0A9P8IBE3_9PEZI|nr:hypothetical protein FGG08_004439 [Glutinoglossum americanum]
MRKKYSEFHSFTIPIHKHTYPSIRIFYRPHANADSLPTTPSPLPLLVFIHGLGGSLSQFHPLLKSLANPAPCLGIDLPGCGLSSFEPKSWDAYTVGALVELLALVIENYRDSQAGQGIVLVGHSMGCSLAALLASSSSPYPSRIADHTLGLVGICPRSSPLSEKETAVIRRLLWIPSPLFDLWRRWDRRGGTESPSVSRFVGKEADLETKKLQEKFNEQSRTAVWRRMVKGLMDKKGGDERSMGGLPGRQVWSGLEVPVLLVAGEADNITRPEEVEKIAEFLGKSGADHKTSDGGVSGTTPDAPTQAHTPKIEKPGPNNSKTVTKDRGLVTQCTRQSNQAPKPRASISIPKPRKLLKRTILPAPASHALMYTSSSCHILSGLISDFLAAHVDPRLSLGWQLQYLATDGKWAVKNLIKWQAVVPVSGVIGGIFRAMKTLREADKRHNPKRFAEEWGPTGNGEARIGDVVDISHDSPVYDPHGLESGGVRYHKFPTVSKIPPMPSEVSDFVAVIDRLLAERTSRTSQSSDSENPMMLKGHEQHLVIGVHCHYGFNRTGFFICSYLIERRNYGVQQAIDEFAWERPPGIRHGHFIDELFVRYCVGLRRVPTL